MSSKNLNFTIAAIAVGLSTLAGTQMIMKEQFFQDLGAACGGAAPLADSSSSSSSSSSSLLHPYEPLLGGEFVCIVTNFVFQLTQQTPDGMIAWFLTVSTAMPVLAIMYTESDRPGAKGLLRFPSLIILIGQIVGISVAVPLLWIPSYIWGHGAMAAPLPTPTPLTAVLLMMLYWFVCTILTFTLDTSTYAWTVVAGILTGPSMAILPVLTYYPMRLLATNISNSNNDDDMTTIASQQERMTTLYTRAGGIAFVLWVAAVLSGLQQYSALGTGMASSSPSVRFMVVDAVGMHVSLLLYLAYRYPMDVPRAALGWTFLLGPGASGAYAMTRFGDDEATTATTTTEQTSTTAKKKD